MGVINIDTQAYDYLASGTINRITSPHAIHLVLTKDELEGKNGLYQASGGSTSGLYSNTLSGANNVPAKLNTQINNFTKTVNIISSAFGLTKKELASACELKSRKTLYNWIDGKSQPRKKAVKRIFDLFLIAQEWKQSGFSNDAKLLHQPIIDGKSVLDFLTNENLNKELILFAGSRLFLTTQEQKTLEDPFA
jgi:hypothetical protein